MKAQDLKEKKNVVAEKINTSKTIACFWFDFQR